MDLVDNSPYSALLKVAGYDPTAVSSLTTERSKLMDERSALTNSLLNDSGSTPGGTFGRFLAAILPVAVAGAMGGKRAAGVAAGPAAEALTLSQQMDMLNRKQKREDYALRREGLDAQVKTLDSQIAAQNEIKADIGKEVIKNEMGMERDKYKAGLDLELQRHKIAADQAFEAVKMDRADEREKMKIDAQKQAYIEKTDHLYKLKAELEKTKAGVKGVADKKPRKVSEDVALEMGDADSATAAISNIDQQHRVLRQGIVGGKLGEVLSTGVSRGASSLASSLTNGLFQTDELLFSDSVKKAAQVVGRYLEGGKLSNADYEDKYVHFFPKTFDNENTSKAKLKMLSQMLAERKKARLTNLGNAGFDVSPWLGTLRSAVQIADDPTDPNIKIVNGQRVRLTD